MEPIINDSTAELPDDELTDKNCLDRYKMEIQLYDKDYKTWETRSTKIVKRYKDERTSMQTNPTRFNILYSNVQTLFPAAYGNDPKPDIQRRFKDDDVLGRVTSDVLERCTSFFVNPKFSDTVKHCLQDRLLPGRGVSWVRYEPHFRDVELSKQDTDGQITDTIYTDEEVYYEEVCHDYVHWKDFGHNVARIWDEVYCGWRKAYLTKQELIKRFGKKKAALIPLDYSPRGLSDEKKSEVMKKATIYELWDKNKKKVYWLHLSIDEFLDVKDDPLKLPEFFPFPKPLIGIVTNDSLIPVPDYIEYQDQAMELDELTTRINQITKSIKVVGVYDASAAGVERMLNEGVENRLIAVDSWAVFGEKGGLKGAMQLMPIEELSKVLMTLYEARDKVKADLYEITGIADIIRGASKASETATAQNIKSRFATLRLDTIQHSVARFARDMVVNTALIIANHFSLDTIKQISGVQLLTKQEKQTLLQQPPPPQGFPEKMQEMLENPTWEEVYGLLQDQPHLTFKIDIETDSTIKQDEEEDKKARMEFLTAAGTFIQQATQIQNPELMPLLVQMLLFGVRGFKVGKGLEATFRTVLQKVEKSAGNPQPPKPDPAMEKIKSEQAQAQMEQQGDMARLQADQQADVAKIQAAKESDSAKIQADIAMEQMRIQADKEIAQNKINADMQIEREKQAHEINVNKMLKPEDYEAEMQDVANTMKMILQAVVESNTNSQQHSKMMLDGMNSVMANSSSPKEITLDNGRKAIVKPQAMQ